MSPRCARFTTTCPCAPVPKDTPVIPSVTATLYPSSQVRRTRLNLLLLYKLLIYRRSKVNPFVPLTAMPAVTDPCALSPCGPNTRCDNGVCTCLDEYQGNPYVGCRPECVLNTDCPQNRACVRNKCVDPCPGICGENAQCLVHNHIPMCSCLNGMVGNAFVRCSVLQGTTLSLLF